jgi:pimeloyl-ACP methyl ester carboxylesterase
MKLLSLIILFLLIFSSCEKEELLEKNARQNFFVRNDGADIPVVVEGNTLSKVFILYLHGGPSDGGITENYNTVFTDPLEEKYAMVYYDQRGMGVASGKYREDKLTLDKSVEDLEKIITVMKKRYGKDIKIFLFGGSWGGLLGCAYLVKGDNQQKISGWIEVGGAHNIPLVKTSSQSLILKVGEEQIAKGNSVGKWESIISFAKEYDPSDKKLDNWLKINEKGHEGMELLIKDGEIKNSSISTKEALKYLFFSPSNILTHYINDNINKTGMTVASNSNIGDYSCSHLLQNVKIPCLFLWGEYDLVVPPEVAVDGYNNISTAPEDKKMVIFKNGHHNILNSNTNEVHSEFFTFIERYR